LAFDAAPAALVLCSYSLMTPLSLLPLAKTTMPAYAAQVCKDTACNAERLSLLSQDCYCSMHHSMIADMIICTLCCLVAIMLSCMLSHYLHMLLCYFAHAIMLFAHAIVLFTHAIMLFTHVVMLLRHTIVLFMHAMIATLQQTVKHQACC